MIPYDYYQQLSSDQANSQDDNVSQFYQPIPREKWTRKIKGPTTAYIPGNVEISTTPCFPDQFFSGGIPAAVSLNESRAKKTDDRRAYRQAAKSKSMTRNLKLVPNPYSHPGQTAGTGSGVPVHQTDTPVTNSGDAVSTPITPPATSHLAGEYTPWPDQTVESPLDALDSMLKRYEGVWKGREWGQDRPETSRAGNHLQDPKSMIWNTSMSYSFSKTYPYMDHNMAYPFYNF